MGTGEETASPDDIDVGKVGSEMRFCRAKEAVRQGEGRLNTQSSVRTALEARATAITGWSSASLLAAAAVIFSSGQWQVRMSASVVSVPLFCCAAMCVHAARPRDWAMVGYDPNLILENTLGIELELLESMAQGLAPGIQANNKRLNSMGRNLRVAGWLLIAAPGIGAVAYLCLRITL
jgi:hypothetical protein